MLCATIAIAHQCFFLTHVWLEVLIWPFFNFLLSEPWGVGIGEFLTWIMIYKCGFVKVREGLRKKKSRRSDPEDKFVINSGKLLKPNFCENFCPYKLFLFLCHSFWMTLWVFLQYFRFSLEHIVIIFGQGLPVRAWEEKKQRREMQAGNQPHASRVLREVQNMFLISNAVPVSFLHRLVENCAGSVLREWIL